MIIFIFFAQKIYLVIKSSISKKIEISKISRTVFIATYTIKTMQLNL